MGIVGLSSALLQQFKQWGQLGAMGREMKKLRKGYSKHEFRRDTSANSEALVANG